MTPHIQDTKSEEEQQQLIETQPWRMCPRVVPYRNVDSLQSVFSRTRKKVDTPKLVPYSLRHKMTTVLRSKQVPEDQIAIMLGHHRPEFRTTRLYGEFDPSYLRDATNAIDEYLYELNKFTERDLFAKTQLQKPGITKVVNFVRAKNIKGQ